MTSFVYDNSFKDVIKENLINYTSEEFLIAERPYQWWISKYALPLHINFESIIIKNLRAFKNSINGAYGGKGRVYFSVKTYPNARVLGIVASEGVGADVVSENELKASIEAGIPTNKIVLNGNCKEDVLIEKAISKNITIIADNIEEFKIISSIAERINIKANLLLRLSGFSFEQVTPDSVFTSGTWTKFGEHIDNVEGFMKTIDGYPFINFMGFHVHIGTQITDFKAYLFVIKKMIELSLHLLKKFNINTHILNIGGGFPAQYLNLPQWTHMNNKIVEGNDASLTGDNTKIFTWGNFKKGHENFYTEHPKSSMLDKIFSSSIVLDGQQITVKEALSLIGEPEFVIEPGRAIVADSGVTLVKVSYTRNISYGHELINIEFGSSNMAECLLYPNMKKWMIVNDHTISDSKPYEAFVAGNLCFTGDMLAKYKVILQRKPARGDTLIIFDTGGTGQHLFAATPNSFPRPPRLLVTEQNDVVVLKERDRYQDIF